MNNPSPKISIIIPFYNAERYIASCVASLKKQIFCDFEAIFIDDGSSDRSVEILKALWDERFVLLQQKNAGVSAARNAGLDRAKGDYLAFMDVDDGLEPEYLQKLLDAAVQMNTPIVLCDYYEIYGDGTICENRLPWSNEIIDSERIKVELLPRMISEVDRVSIKGLVWRTFVKRDFWKATQIYFDVNVVVAEDLLFLISLYNRAENIYILSDCLYRYSRNAGSAVNRYYPDGTERNLDFHKRFVALLKSEDLYEQNLYGYNVNKILMYTAAISNLARAPKLLCAANRESMKVLYRELCNEPFNWRDYPIDKGRWISLWMLEHKMYVILLLLYRIKEKIRLKGLIDA